MLAFNEVCHARMDFRRCVTVVVLAPRDLMKEGFPLHDDHIAALLESIGDHEQDIIETILFAVANAR